jgi:hypothetical protein
MRPPRRLAFIVTVAVIIIAVSALLSLSQMTRPAKHVGLILKTEGSLLRASLSSSEVAALNAYGQSDQMRADVAARLERAGIRIRFDPTMDLDWTAYVGPDCVGVHMTNARDRFDLRRFDWVPKVDRIDEHAIDAVVDATVLSVLVRAHGLVDTEEKRESIRAAIDRIDTAGFVDPDELRHP